MADNTQVNQPTTLGDIIRTDEVGVNIKTQIIKVDIGAAGVDGPTVSTSDPLPITAAALPLPTGAATLAAQNTGNASLASIDSKTPALGQAAMAASVPVVIASNQSAVPISAASLPLPLGAATLAEQQAQTALLTTIDGDTGTLAGTVTASRVAVNPISGQAGVAGGTGVDGATVQRVTLATNVALPAGTNNIGDVDVLTLPPQRYAQVFGTAQTIINSGTDIAAGAFGAAGTDYDNTSDAAIPLAPYVVLMIEMPDWAAAPVAGTVVQLWGLLINTDGTDDDTDAPSAAASGGAILLASFVIAAADALQRRTRVASTAGIQSGFTPYVFNGTAQNMNNDGGTNLVVKATPMTYRLAA